MTPLFLKFKNFIKKLRTGTGLEGGICPSTEGICISTSLMNNVLKIHEDDFDVVVEPGVTRKQLNS